MNFLCGGAFASNNSFLKELEEDMRPTLNDKGDHLQNLGPTQEAFYKYCKALDANEKIQHPVVALFGEAYGKRAAEVLQRTNRLTVFLNNFDARHFEGIKHWCKNMPYSKRLLFAPGSFLQIHENEGVQNFSKPSPIKFHVVLMANVFHYLHPSEGIQGLRYIADHLVDDGEAFLMTAHMLRNTEGDAMEQKVALGLSYTTELAHHLINP